MNRLIHILLFFLIISFKPVFAELGVTITEPGNKASFAGCDTIHFQTVPTEGEAPIKEVRLYYDQARSVGRTSKNTWDYDWKDVVSGSYQVYARVKDDNDNIAYSDTIWVFVGEQSPSEQLRNSTFDCKFSPWVLNQYEGAVAQAFLMDDGYFDDNGYVMLEISEQSTMEWHIQLSQTMPIQKGHEYEVTFLADADDKRNIIVGIQASSEPYETYLWETVEIDGVNLYGPYTMVSDTTDKTAIFKFNCGNDKNTLYFDEVHVMDYSITSVKEYRMTPGSQKIKSYELMQAFPNPFNMNTRIQFELSNPADIRLEMFNMLGQKVKTLAEGAFDAGMHTVYWNATDDEQDVVPTGVYIYRLQVQDENKPVELTRKVVLMK